MPKTPLVLAFFVLLSLLFIIFSVLFIFAPLIKQCENFILYLTFQNKFQSKF